MVQTHAQQPAVVAASSSNPPLLQRCGGVRFPPGAFAHDGEEPTLQRRATGAGPEVAPPIVHDVLRSPGQPLDEATRTNLSRAFGRDFSQVRVHTGPQAAASAQAVQARAYTVGQQVVFGAGQYAPTSSHGRRLLAHELVHVVQQGHGRAAPDGRRQAMGISEPGSGGEREADVVAAQVLENRVGAGRLAPVTPVATSRASGLVQRQPAGPSAAPAQTAAQKVEEAVKHLRGVHPLLIHKALSAVQVGGGSKPVHEVEHVRGGKPVTSVFTLQLTVAPLEPPTIAHFRPPEAPEQSGGTQTFAMAIAIDSLRVAQQDPKVIARSLFHEGMHMQLFIDRRVPSWKRSTFHAERYQDYLATARKNENHALVVTELTKFLQKNVKGNTRAGAVRQANEIVETIIEEKYVTDVTERDIDGRRTPGSGRRPVYRAFARAWLVSYLKQVKAANGSPDEITSMGSKLAELWLHIDAEAPRPPLHDAITGKYVESPPGILPPPLPAAVQ